MIIYISNNHIEICHGSNEARLGESQYDTTKYQYSLAFKIKKIYNYSCIYKIQIVNSASWKFLQLLNLVISFVGKLPLTSNISVLRTISLLGKIAVEGLRVLLTFPQQAWLGGYCCCMGALLR